MTWIERQFPQAHGKHVVTSEEDDNYNCIAWAAEGDKTAWWSHEKGYKWPGPRSPRIESLVAVFSGLGYVKVDSPHLDPGFTKVALYHKDGMWQHAARQLPTGRWASKLGPDEDIEHDDPDCMCGDSYGSLYCLMQKRSPT